jgi:hypothetical protein
MQKPHDGGNQCHDSMKAIEMIEAKMPFNEFGPGTDHKLVRHPDKRKCTKEY